MSNLEKEYPEHARMTRVKPLSQALGEFLEWLRERDYWICSLNKGVYYPELRSIEAWLADHFDIDLGKLSEEKDRMFEKLRQGADR